MDREQYLSKHTRIDSRQALFWREGPPETPRTPPNLQWRARTKLAPLWVKNSQEQALDPALKLAGNNTRCHRRRRIMVDKTDDVHPHTCLRWRTRNRSNHTDPIALRWDLQEPHCRSKQARHWTPAAARTKQGGTFPEKEETRWRGKWRTHFRKLDLTPDLSFRHRTPPRNH